MLRSSSRGAVTDGIHEPGDSVSRGIAAGPRILILYSRTGGGHTRVAETLAAQLRQLRPSSEIVMLDGLERTDWGVRVDPAKVFLTLTTRFIRLYNLNYRLTNSRHGVPLLRRSIRMTVGRTVTRALQEHQPDLVVSTHHFLSPSAIIGAGTSAPWVMIVSDLGEPHRLWFDPRIHSVVVPSDDMLAYAQRCLEVDRGGFASQPALLNLGFPIASGLFAPSVTSPKERQKRLLVMGGGAGTGSLDALVAGLSRGFPDHRIVVVCGWNARLRAKLERSAQPNVQVLGFVDNVPELMAASDMVITKAGPVTIMEAVAAGKPIVVTDWVGLQERDNVQFVVDHGLGIYSERVSDLPQAVQTIYERYEAFVSAKPRNVDHGPDRIARYLLEITDAASANALSSRVPLGDPHG